MFIVYGYLRGFCADFYQENVSSERK